MSESPVEQGVVVCAAIVHSGRLLAQRRDWPVRDAGRWELPGGRVEPGEPDEVAVVRECQEELGVEIVPMGRVGVDVPLRNGMLLRAFHAGLVDPTATPRAVEHREVRWLEAGDLAGMDWLDADRLLLSSLRTLLDG